MSIIDTRHPDYLYSLPDWSIWRDIWDGGDTFVRRYLEKWSERESIVDFERRRNITPVPGFAKAALVDIKNSVFNRMSDISRRGGTISYGKAIAGEAGGVDRRGSSMNHFIGTEILPEMLSMGRIGVYVDNIAPPGPTLADARNATPYLYTYRVEDILSWQRARPEDDSDFNAILLRDWCIKYETSFGKVQLPKEQYERYRLVWKDDDGFVYYQFFSSAGDPILPDGTPGGDPVKLNIKRIPFVMFDIETSLLKDIAKHQIALLNLASSDISYALKANFPFYVEQGDTRGMGGHLKTAVSEDGTSSTGGQQSADKEIKVGTLDGRLYDTSVSNAPQFINPSSEPLEASMKLQEKLENDIRKLVNLAVVSLGNSRASGEAKQMDNQGLESGLAFIGLVLESGEKKIADFWSAYEGNDSRDTVIIKYPDQYRVKSKTERIEEAEKLTKLIFSLPSISAKKELCKDAASSLLGGRVTTEKMSEIHKEIDKASYATSDPTVIEMAKEQGLASDVTLSNALGFNGEVEIPKAREDHALRVETIQAAQSSEKIDAGARGVKDMSVDKKAGKKEKEQARNTDLEDSTKSRERGKTRASKKSGE